MPEHDKINKPEKGPGPMPRFMVPSLVELEQSERDSISKSSSFICLNPSTASGISLTNEEPRWKTCK